MIPVFVGASKHFGLSAGLAFSDVDERPVVGELANKLVHFLLNAQSM